MVPSYSDVFNVPELCNYVVDYALPLKNFTLQSLKDHCEGLRQLSLVSTVFRNNLRDKLCNVKILKEMVDKYRILDEELYQYYAELTMRVLQDCPPFLFPLLKSFKGADEEKKKEIENEIKKIIEIMPNSIHSKMGKDSTSSRSALSPLAYACVEPWIPRTVVELFLTKGANPHILYFKHHRIICLHQDFREEKREKEIEKLDGLQSIIEATDPCACKEEYGQYEEEDKIKYLLQRQPSKKMPKEAFNSFEYREYLLIDQVRKEVASTLLVGIIAQEDWESMPLQRRVHFLRHQSNFYRLLTYTDISVEQLSNMNPRVRHSMLNFADRAIEIYKEIPAIGEALWQMGGSERRLWHEHRKEMGKLLGLPGIAVEQLFSMRDSVRCDFVKHSNRLLQMTGEQRKFWVANHEELYRLVNRPHINIGVEQLFNMDFEAGRSAIQDIDQIFLLQIVLDGKKALQMTSEQRHLWAGYRAEIETLIFGPYECRSKAIDQLLSMDIEKCKFLLQDVAQIFSEENNIPEWIAPCEAMRRSLFNLDIVAKPLLSWDYSSIGQWKYRDQIFQLYKEIPAISRELLRMPYRQRMAVGKHYKEIAQQIKQGATGTVAELLSEAQKRSAIAEQEQETLPIIDQEQECLAIAEQEQKRREQPEKLETSNTTESFLSFFSDCLSSVYSFFSCLVDWFMGLIRA